MANLPLAFAETLAGGVLLTAGISGSSIADVFAGNITLKGPSSSSGGAAPSAGGPASGALKKWGPVGRTDQGVDFTINGPIPWPSSTPAKVESIHGSGWPGGGWMALRLQDGTNRLVFVAENITPTVRVGQLVHEGDQIATGHGGLEAGWAANPFGSALAHAHYHEGDVTAEGRDFKTWLGL